MKHIYEKIMIAYWKHFNKDNYDFYIYVQNVKAELDRRVRLHLKSKSTRVYYEVCQQALDELFYFWK